MLFAKTFFAGGNFRELHRATKSCLQRTKFSEIVLCKNSVSSFVFAGSNLRCENDFAHESAWFCRWYQNHLGFDELAAACAQVCATGKTELLC